MHPERCIPNYIFDHHIRNRKITWNSLCSDQDTEAICCKNSMLWYFCQFKTRLEDSHPDSHTSFRVHFSLTFILTFSTVPKVLAWNSWASKDPISLMVPCMLLKVTSGTLSKALTKHIFKSASTSLTSRLMILQEFLDSPFLTWFKEETWVFVLFTNGQMDLCRQSSEKEGNDWRHWRHWKVGSFSITDDTMVETRSLSTADSRLKSKHNVKTNKIKRNGKFFTENFGFGK